MSSAPLTLLNNAEVFSPDPLGRRQVLVGGGSILALGSDLGQIDPSLCQVIDLAGARSCPACSTPTCTSRAAAAKPAASRVPAVQLTDLTRAGVTTAVGVLGTDGTTRTVAALVAPTLGLREQGLSAWCCTGSYQCPRTR